MLLTSWLKMTFKSVDKESFLTLYKSFVRSIIDYRGGVHFPKTKKNIQLLENIQKRATIKLPEFKDLTYTERHKRLNLPTLNYRRKRFDFIQLYEIVRGFEEIESGKLVYFNDIFTRSHLFKIQKLGCKKKLRMDLFQYDVSIVGTP